MRRINYRSDFDFLLSLKSGNGEAVGWPEFDWLARFWTDSRTNAFEASCIGGVCVNCYNDNGSIHVVADNHNLLPGRLCVEFVSELPNAVYGDGSERVVQPSALDIELVTGRGDDTCEFESEVALPVYVKNLEHLEELVGASLDEIIARLEAVLGEGVEKPETRVSPRVNQVLRRGIISLGSKPGYVYRNTGEVRVPVKPGRTATVSLDALSELDLLTDTDGVPVYGPNSGATVAGDTSVITVDRPSSSLYKGLRLTLGSDNVVDRPYVMMCDDGKIRTVTADELGFVPQAYELEAPVVSETSTDENYLDTLLARLAKRVGGNGKSGCLVAQKLCSSLAQRNGGIKYGNNRRRWRTIWGRSSGERSTAAEIGIYRVRYETNRSHSRWVVFTCLYGRLRVLQG